MYPLSRHTSVNKNLVIVCQKKNLVIVIRVVCSVPMSDYVDNSSPILQEDLIVEILLRVPARSLLPMKCVCKLWKTLISDPQFAKSHLLRLNSTAYPHLVSRHESSRTIIGYNVEPLLEDHLNRIEPDFKTMRHNYLIIGSCNGLLCLLQYNLNFVILWNPFLNMKSHASPTLVSHYGENDHISYYGFGYDQVNLRYKVLIACINIDDFSEIVTRIYSSGENSWRTIQNFPGDIDCFPSSDDKRVGKCVNGTLNWVVKKNGFSSTQEIIISFDLEKETYGEVFLPQSDDADNVSNVILDVLSDCLCLCFDSEKTQLVVWLMKEYGVVESWTKFMTIPYFILTHMPPLFIRDPFYYYPVNISNTHWVVRQRNLTMLPSFVDPLFISGNGIVHVKTMRSRLFLYLTRNCNPYSRKLARCSLFDDLQIYHESLVPPRW
jgi:F-box interacting protein